MSTFQVAWGVSAIVLLLLFMGLGVWIARRPAGILIDSRGKFSLSRLQLVLWTFVVLSAFVGAAYAFSTADIEVPEQVWTLMGISMGSTAGAVIVNGTKANQNPSAAMVHGMTATNRRGVLATNSTPTAARWSDLFQGDEIVDDSYVDISKVQMFFFTVAVLYAYTTTVWSLDAELHGKVDFPPLSTSLVTLLGISHVGYLTVKAAPKTPTTAA